MEKAFSIRGKMGEKWVPSTSSKLTVPWHCVFRNSAAIRVFCSTVAMRFSLEFFSRSPRSKQTFSTFSDRLCSLIHSVNPSYQSDPEMLMMLLKASVLNPVQMANSPDSETPNNDRFASCIWSESSTSGMILEIRRSKKSRDLPPKGLAFRNTPGAGQGVRSSFQSTCSRSTKVTAWFSAKVFSPSSRSWVTP